MVDSLMSLREDLADADSLEGLIEVEDAILEMPVQRFFLISKHIDDYYHSLSKKLGIPYGSFVVLDALAMQDGCTQKQIRDDCMLSKQSINTSLKRLEAQGYLRIEDTGHRSTEVFLTQEGKEFLSKGIDRIPAAENRAYASLSEEEQHLLTKIYEKFANALFDELEQLVADAELEDDSEPKQEKSIFDRSL